MSWLNDRMSLFTFEYHGRGSIWSISFKSIERDNRSEENAPDRLIVMVALFTEPVEIDDFTQFIHRRYLIWCSHENQFIFNFNRVIAIQWACHSNISSLETDNMSVYDRMSCSIRFSSFFSQMKKDFLLNLHQ